MIDTKEEVKDYRILGKVTGKTPINLWNDAAIKAIFTAKESRNVLVRFLSSTTHYTKEELRRASVKSVELPNLKHKEKVKRTDILTTLDHQQGNIIVEINQFPSRVQREKNARYAFSLILTETLEGTQETAKTIEINIDKTNTFKTHPEAPVRECKIRDQFGEEVTDIYLGYYFIVANQDQLDYNNPRDREVLMLMKVLSCTTLDELRELVEGDEDYMSLAKKVENFFVYDALVDWYNSEEGQATFKRCENQEYLERGREEGRTEGREEGQNSERKKIILTMHNHGMKIEEITKFCNLTEEEVQKIIKSNVEE